MLSMLCFSSITASLWVGTHHCSTLLRLLHYLKLRAVVNESLGNPETLLQAVSIIVLT